MHHLLPFLFRAPEKIANILAEMHRNHHPTLRNFESSKPVCKMRDDFLHILFERGILFSQNICLRKIRNFSYAI